MNSGATYRAHEIVVVPFPFTERPVSKRRPALVLSSDHFNREHDQLLLAMITSGTTPWTSDLPIEHWREAGLAARCILRFKIFTLPKSLVLARVGDLFGSDRLAVEKRLATVITGVRVSVEAGQPEPRPPPGRGPFRR
jgi:mRNA interferase MazF